MEKYPYKDSYYPEYTRDAEGRVLEVKYTVLDGDPLEVEIDSIWLEGRQLHHFTEEMILNNLEGQFIREIMRELQRKKVAA